MDQNFKLSDIKIGCADGEKEAEESNFLDIFYNENNKYEQIMNKNKFIISGRKGTGKTILAKYIQKNNKQKNMIVYYSKFNDISLHEYTDIENHDISDNIRLLFQNFYIYKQFLTILYDNKLSLTNFISRSFSTKQNFHGILRYRNYKKAYKQLDEFYNLCYPSGVYHETEVINIQRIVEATDAQVNANMGDSGGLKSTISETSELSKEVRYKKKNFMELLDSFKKIVLETLKYADVILIIDDLDEIKTTSKEHSIDFLIHFVTKINEINMEIHKVSEKSKCILLLRSDIISKFSSRSNNIQKIITDSNIELQWFGPTNRNELAEMIMHKIKKSTSSSYFSKMNFTEMKTTLFPKSNDLDGLHYILNHSFGRPRDVITYLNAIINTSPNESKFTMQIVKNAELEYSNNFLEELKNEMSLTLSYEVINDIETLLRKFGKKTFFFEEFKNYYYDNHSSYPSSFNLESTMQYLYELGALGTIRQKRKRKRRYDWYYRNGGELLNIERMITIHPGLWKALNI